MRFRIQPRDVPLAIAARRMGLTIAAFEELLPSLYRAGFPKQDPVTGNFDLVAMDIYCDRRNPSLFGRPNPTIDAVGAEVVRARLKGIAPLFGGGYMDYRPDDSDGSPEAAARAREEWRRQHQR